MRFLLVTIAAMLGVLLTASLGRWQLNRASQKTAAMAELLAQSSKPILDTPELVMHADPATLIHRSVRLRGQWVHNKTIFLDNRQMGGRVGFSVVTPLALENSSVVVVVQRGWAPRAFDDRLHTPEINTPLGVVELVGRISPSPPKLYELSFTESGVIRQNLDIAHFGVELSMPMLSVTLQQTGADSEGLSRQWPAPNFGVDRHYGYAFQWFGLSVLIAALYIWFQLVRRFFYRSKDPIPHV